MATTKEPPPNPDHSFTTYVQADPTTFRYIVQKLTGAPAGSPTNLPLTVPPRRPPPTSDATSKKQRLQDRRQAPTKLEIKLTPCSTRYSKLHYYKLMSGSLVSPVSTMDSSSFLSPLPSNEKLELVDKYSIADKGFYLHPPEKKPPKLLHLFPLSTDQ
ncbi:hypothetical protein J5N97_027060 [Dioscorea zingiberensis]|uniref:VQ domain-containing protein n=1 Tax=Dioscorea zingiberensis TaxID=325984 RepID=A0A9D5C4L1_9LILI|nr:hypothetical protein J5N97_027060 [Dioscorea zingiberensis]